MINLKKIYEDALMSIGDASASTGDIAPTSANIDTDVVKNGTSTDDVLGKSCDHHKDGYLSTSCFHIPARCKKELPGKKKKNQKNPYAKGATIITDNSK